MARSRAKISLSLDGPAWMHDADRRTRASGGTHARVMRRLGLLHSAGIVPPVITVLTDASLAHPDALFNFFRSVGSVDMAFNVEEVEGVNTASSLARSGQEAAFRRFLDWFISPIQAGSDSLMLREFRYAIGVVASGSLPAGANQEAEPMQIIGIAADGSVSTFSPEFLGMRDARCADFLFGSIIDDDIETIERRVSASVLAHDIAIGLANCLELARGFPSAVVVRRPISFLSSAIRKRPKPPSAV